MKEQDQIKAIAELDGRAFPYGLQIYQRNDHGYTGQWWSCDQHGSMSRQEYYLTSRDAIVPVIEKLVNTPEFNYMRFCEAIKAIRNEEVCSFGNWQLVRCMLTTPAQLCEALLRATGKWIEK